jgi:hypothetical protein
MEIGLFIIRLAILAVLYGFLAAALWLIWREFRWMAAGPAAGVARLTGRLFVLDSGGTGLTPGDLLRLEGSTTLGRSPGNSIVLSDSSISARHAVLTYEHGCWWVQDAGSTNGTQLNGDFVKRKLPLRFNDVLTLGQVQLRLEDDSPARDITCT